jgi:ABC-type phosphate transport system substrate-binding protein
MSVGASLASAAALSIAWAGTAGATATPPVNGTVNSPASGSTYTLPGATPANNYIIGSGSATTYDMMQALDSLFNNVPGCNITTSSFTYVQGKGNQQLNFSCLQVPASDTSVPSGVITGATSEQVPVTVGNNEQYAYLDNPVNDVAFSEPPMGSSNGIEQLENARNNAASGGSGIGASNSTENVTGINYARSSRILGSTDIQGLNFVAYAVDGVSWIHFTKVGTSPTPSSKVTDLTPAQVQGIWNGTFYNWAQLGGKPGPIVVYSAQEGSGTQSTWKTYLGFDPSSTSNLVNCTTEVGEVLGTSASKDVFPLGGTASVSQGCAGPKLIFENELTSVSSADYANMIFFYSVGKYNLQCEGLKEKVSSGVDKSPIAQDAQNVKVGAGCGGSPTVGGAGKILLGNINNEAPTPGNVLGGEFAPVRDLYNVYSNGSNPSIPAATPAALNYISEVGFLCKPQTIDGTNAAGASATGVPTASAILDPATGGWYETEIDNTILGQGFIPIAATGGALYSTLQFPTAANAAEGSVPHPAAGILAAGPASSPAPGYGATYLDAGMPNGSTVNTTIPTGPNPPGFCAVTTTDGNTDQ